MEEIIEDTETPKPLERRGSGRFSWLKNKYLIAGVCFIAWMFFFDKNDVFTQFDRVKHSKLLTKNENLQVKLNIETAKELSLLKTNAQTIEKYARENFLMKKDNEDVFIVNDASAPK